MYLGENKESSLDFSKFKGIFLTINLDGNMSTLESHNLADSLEKSINELDKIYKTVVHVNPV